MYDVLSTLASTCPNYYDFPSSHFGTQLRQVQQSLSHKLQRVCAPPAADCERNNVNSTIYLLFLIIYNTICINSGERKNQNSVCPDRQMDKKGKTAQGFTQTHTSSLIITAVAKWGLGKR